MTIRYGLLVLLLAWNCPVTCADNVPLAQPYLIKGDHVGGAAALREHLQANPKDDQARFGLGLIEFLQTAEHLGTNLYRYGLRTERAFRGPGRERLPLSQLAPQNPNPEQLSYVKLRQIAQTIVDDLKRVEDTLAAITDPTVKLRLPMDRVKVDFFGLGKPIDAVLLMQMNGTKAPSEPYEIAFDRGDVNWLRGYCHLLSAWAEIYLAVDTQEMFECCAHLLFEDVVTPHKFLLDPDRAFDRIQALDQPTISDVLAYLHLWRFPVKEPERMKRALAHLEAMLVQAREMWTHYLAETDNDHEWIPNPKQTGVLGVPVSLEMVTLWQIALKETDLVLQGKALIPFWRGKDKTVGLNFRRIFTEPRNLDPFLWWQGTAATPYLEEGPISDLARGELFNRLNTTFGGTGFFRFAFWFN